jgi:hypothetical protein
VTSSGLPNGTLVQIDLHSDTVSLFSGRLGSSASVLTLTIPVDLPTGDHTLVFTASPPSGAVLTRSVAVTVTPADEGAVDLPTHALEETPVAKRTLPDMRVQASEASRHDSSAPSVLSGAIPTFEQVLAHPASLALAGAFAALIVLLVALPAELLTAVLGANSHRLRRGLIGPTAALARMRARSAAALATLAVVRDRFAALPGAGVIGPLGLILGVSVVFGFVDPDFGLNLVSLRMVLSLAAALFLITYGASWATRLLLRRFWDAESRITLHPGLAVFAVIGVIVARLLEFSPGFLLGIVIGLELVRAGRRAELASVLVQFGIILGLAVVGWLGYSLLVAGGPPDGFWPALGRDTLVALTAEGLIALLVGALPLQFLEGRDLWERSKGLWLGCFFVIAVAFSLLVLPTASAATSAVDLGVWSISLLVFAALAVSVWAIFARIDQRERHHAERGDETDADADAERVAADA